LQPRPVKRYGGTLLKCLTPLLSVQEYIFAFRIGANKTVEKAMSPYQVETGFGNYMLLFLLQALLPDTNP
jgi:hypothetical protein